MYFKNTELDKIQANVLLVANKAAIMGAQLRSSVIVDFGKKYTPEGSDKEVTKYSVKISPKGKEDVKFRIRLKDEYFEGGQAEVVKTAQHCPDFGLQLLKTWDKIKTSIEEQKKEDDSDLQFLEKFSLAAEAEPAKEVPAT